MKVIVVMFDTLNRRYLPNYGNTRVHAPNFERLGRQAVTFDNCYAGSMPCMPARREMHTGRYNFLHRSWGPLEPFDDSLPEILHRHGIYSHLVTDHNHYWEDGGATYHNRFSSYEFFRGQEGDPWKGRVGDVDIPEAGSWRRIGERQDVVNREYFADIADHPQTLTVDAGLHFLDVNSDADNWMLQIECFDPHEPFFSYAEHKRHYPHHYDGVRYDWPDYRRVTEDEATVAHVQAEYSALLTMCDDSLGRVLDMMDERQLWDDTMLIVCTDHGLLLGEHEWWGKMVQPWYDETIHTPLFVWDPRIGTQGERRAQLVQTIDFAPTILDFFGIEPTADMQGRSIVPSVAAGHEVRDWALFGAFGSHVNITDGRYVYMRASVDARNAPLLEHTLMPTHMHQMFSPAELAGAQLHPPLSFTKGAPVLTMQGYPVGNPHSFGTLLFDLANDPEQLDPLVDDELELRMAGLLRDAMVASDAPPSQFERIGLPASGEVTAEHLLVRAQFETARGAMEPVPPAAEFEIGDGVGVLTPLEILLGDEAQAAVLRGQLRAVDSPGYLARYGHTSPWQIAHTNRSLTAPVLRALHADLRATSSATG